MKRKPYSRAGHAIWGPWAVRCWWFLKLWPLQGVKASVIFFPQDLCQNWGQRLLYYYYNTYITHISYIYRCTINDIIYANAIIHSISVIYIYIIYISYVIFINTNTMNRGVPPRLRGAPQRPGLRTGDVGAESGIHAGSICRSWAAKIQQRSLTIISHWLTIINRH